MVKFKAFKQLLEGRMFVATSVLKIQDESVVVNQAYIALWCSSPPTPKLACFLPHLKIINTFLKGDIYIL